MKLSKYIKRWLKRREAEGLRAIQDYRSGFRCHIKPTIGRLELEEIRPSDVRGWLAALKQDAGLAPRSVSNIYQLLHGVLSDAVAEERIAVNPCKLRRGERPKNVDRDPAWRAGAVFTRDEIEALISDPRVPWMRRVLWALLVLTGARFGEIAALGWTDYDAAARPLGRIMLTRSFSSRRLEVGPTKTAVARAVPVHPTLARILEVHRSAVAGPLIIPSARGAEQRSSRCLRAFKKDLHTLGFRARRIHDLRRTFISLLRADGARREIVQRVTHARPADVYEAYAEVAWVSLCEEISKLQVALPKSLDPTPARPGRRRVA